MAIICLAAYSKLGCSTTPNAISYFNVADYSKVVDMEFKRCSKCKKEKQLSEFYKDKAQTSGLRPDCKECVRLGDRTKIGRIRQIYNGQRSHRKFKGLDLPTYNFNEFKEWVLSQDVYHNIYDKWVESGYKKSESPSVDRINNHIGYTIKNIQIMTWADNFKKSNVDIRRGDIITKNLWGGGNRSIIGKNLKTGEVRDFISLSEAKRELGVQTGNVAKVLKGQRPHTLNWSFKYKSNV